MMKHLLITENGLMQYDRKKGMLKSDAIMQYSLMVSLIFLLKISMV